jgi:anti-anti-sigma factor
LEYVFQPDALGSAGALCRAKQLLQETFIVMPADEVADLEIAQAIRQHVARGALATVIVQPGPAHGSRTLWVGADGRLRAAGSVPHGIPAWNDTGIYLFDPCVLDHIPPRLPFDIHQHLLPRLVSGGIPVWSCPLPGYWNPLITLEDYAEAQFVFLSRASVEKPDAGEKITYRYGELESRQVARGIWTGRGVMIHPKARISPPVCIGHNSWIGRDAELGPAAVIGSNVVIDRCATVLHSIILDDTYVGRLVRLENRLVDQDRLIDLCSQAELRIADKLLLGKTHPQDTPAGIKRVLKQVRAGGESWNGSGFRLEQGGFARVGYGRAGGETDPMGVSLRAVGGVKILDLAGCLDASAAGRLRRALIDATAGGPARVVVNLQQVGFMDSSGLSALVLGLERARQRRGGLCLCGLQPPVRLIFELTRFDKVFEIFAREEDAVLAAARA